MSIRTVKPSQLAAELKQYIYGYGDYMEEEMKESANKFGEKAQTDLKNTNAHKDGHKGKRLRKGWRIRRQSGKHTYRLIVHNTNKPTVVHLLEFGHKKVLWGVRTNGRVKARPFVRKIEKKYNRKFVDELKKKAKQY